MDWLINLRVQKGYTQESLAFAIKCNQCTLANIESGRRKPSIELAKKIAKELGFDWIKFFL